MVLFEDTRQQKGRHGVKHEAWDATGVTLIRTKLAFGDYCLPPVVSVDTKASLTELAYDIDHDHERFKRELIGAREAGVRLVVLVENTEGVRDLESLAAWTESPQAFACRKFAKRRLCGVRLAKACVTMAERYGVRFEFCAPDQAAARIVEILCEEEKR